MTDNSSRGGGNGDGNSLVDSEKKGMKKVRVLTVGDGDLTLSLALARAYGDHSIELTSSVLEATEDDFLGSFPDAPITELRDKFNVPICYGVDATQLHHYHFPTLGGNVNESEGEQPSPSPFDLVTFHHPHLGLGSLADSEAEHALRHHQLLCHYLHSARQVSKLVHLCLCGSQPKTWKLVEAAHRQGMHLVKTVSTAAPFSHIWTTIPGENEGLASVDTINQVDDLYNTVVATAAPAGSYGAPRRYRNGKLGSRHFLGKYGYRHRRSEGGNYTGLARDMNVSGSMHYVFAANQDIREEIPSNSVEERTCAICGASFQSDIELKCHLQSPAKPEVARTTTTNRTLSEGRPKESPSFGVSVTCPEVLTSTTTTAQIVPELEKQQLLPQHQYQIKLTVSQTCHDKRLRWFIQHQLKNLSKRQAECMIQAGLVVVNGRVALDSSRILKVHDRVATLCEPEVTTGHEEGSTLREATFAAVDIVERYDNWLVAWKPSGMRTKGRFAGTLESSVSEVEGQIYACHSALETCCPGMCVLTVETDPLQPNNSILSVRHTLTVLIHGRLPENWYPSRLAVLTMEGKWKGKNKNKRKHDEDCSPKSSLIEPPTAAIEIIPKESATTRANDKEDTTEAIAAMLSTVEVVTLVPSSNSLCRFFRQEGFPVVGDTFCRKEYLTLKRSIRNRLKDKLMMGCYRVEIEVSNSVKSIIVDRAIPDKLSAQYWDAFQRVEAAKDMLAGKPTKRETQF